LGGENAVPEEWISSLKSDYENIIRLSGKTRYDTNLEILRAAGVGDRMNLLVCTGKDFADSLSVSSVDYPILLVGDKLNEKQKEFLSNEAKYCHFYIIGGSKAVSEEVREELMNYGAFEDRISGKNRYETSSEVAKYFYSDAHEIVLATGQDFPDGLSGGPLGNVRFAPILLVNPSGKNNFARVFADLKGISHAYILGGEAAVSTLHAEDILGLLPEMEPGTYIKVVISEQTLYYVENGKLIMTSPIVSGYGDTLLDDGTFYVQHMKEKATLKGSDYEEHVDYWIGFGRSGHYSNGGHILGIHDAQWRSEFGGEIYKTDPSHGCINLPLDKEAQLYSLVSIGTEVQIIY
ncbi:MAG: cell wall-binding repeat-containing protein, partial [Erysipelotrichaceae bacterium]|nr:cell wall-binding repeat-containing protein [Erysipelotrichaceae bacterium]